MRKIIVKSLRGRIPGLEEEPWQPLIWWFVATIVIRNHYKGLCDGFFLFILAGGLETKAVSCVGETDPETDSEYLVWKSERGSKTRTGQDGGHQRAFEPKAHARNNKSRCPVEFYKAFRSHRSEAMLEPDAPFYLTINHQRKPTDKVWYLDRPLGKNEIGKFLKDAFAAAKLDDTNKKNVSSHTSLYLHYNTAKCLHSPTNPASGNLCWSAH